MKKDVLREKNSQLELVIRIWTRHFVKFGHRMRRGKLEHVSTGRFRRREAGGDQDYLSGVGGRIIPTMLLLAYRKRRLKGGWRL